MLQQTVSPIADTIFQDTLSFNTLNEKVYYAVTSIDKRFNSSKLSAIITIVKPDKTPPSAPVFSNYRVANKSVHFSWFNSSSADVAGHKIYRKQIGKDVQWKLLKEVTGKAVADSMADNTVIYDSTYAYTIIAIDTNGLESRPAEPLTVTPAIRATAETIPSIENLKVIGNKKTGQISITWEYSKEEPAAFWLYRAVDNGSMQLLQTIDGNKKNYTDTNVTPDTKYQYMVKAVLKNGISTEFTSKVKINL
jgi:uncharacterized protein